MAPSPTARAAIQRGLKKHSLIKPAESSKTVSRNYDLRKDRRRQSRVAYAVALKAQISGCSNLALPNNDSPSRPVKDNIPKQDTLVRLTCDPVPGSDTKRLKSRIAFIKLKIALCGRHPLRVLLTGTSLSGFSQGFLS